MSEFPPIAIVGRACVLPGALSPDELWEAVVNGVDLTSTVPPGRWGIAPDDVMCAGPDDSADRTWSDRGGYVRGFDDVFEPHAYAMPATDVLALDPVFRWTLHTAREALRDAGRVADDAARFGAVFGNLSFPSAGMAAYTQAVSLAAVPGFEGSTNEPLPDARNRFNSGLPALLLERALGLGAGAFALDAACASGLYAVKFACDQLHDGIADLMLAGAVNCADDLCIHLGFTALRALSRTGRSRPFHRDADGLVPAEGCAFVALRRLDDAVADGDTIHGIIRGVGLSNDGRGRGMLVPSSAGQTRAIARALALSGLAPTDISLIECHATGTVVGDATELESTAAVYGDCVDLPIGSLKSNTGHLITAAGVAGLIKVIEAMRHETRPPTLHVDEPLDALAGSPFRLLERAEVWDRAATSDGVLRAAVSAFGFGGNNAHLIVEEPESAAVLAQAAAEPLGPTQALRTPIAIVSIGVSAASAVGRSAFTEALLVASPRLDADGQGRMPPVELPLRGQRFPPNDLKAALAQQVAVLAVTEEALRGCRSLPAASTGVYVGMGTDPEGARFGVRWRIGAIAAQWGCPPDWTATARDSISPVLDAARVMGTMPNIVANRLNVQHDIAGPSLTVSAEERSGIEALALATRALRAREIDAALVGAVDMSSDPVHRAAMAAVRPGGGPDGDAAVMLVLKRLDDAEHDGDTVIAVLPEGRFDADGAPLGERPEMTLTVGGGAGSISVDHLFGHAHAASGLLHVAAAALLLHHRVSLGDVPLFASNHGGGTGLPAGAGPRTASVVVHAMDGVASRSVFLAEASTHHAPARASAPHVRIFSGEMAVDVLADLAAGRESDVGPARLVIVADSAEQFAQRRGRARRHIEAGHPPGEGVHYRSAPVVGELAFVFTGAGAASRGMAAELLRAMPELADPISFDFPLRDVAGWVNDQSATEGGSDGEPTPSDYLWGTAMLTQVHTQLTRHVLRLRPAAAIGYSSGESNSLYAFGVWSDMDAMRAEIVASGMMETELGGSFAAVARAWGRPSAQWQMWNVLAPIDEVRRAIAAEKRVHLAIVNTHADVVIGGDAAACSRVVDGVGRHRCRVLGYNLACHVPEVAAAFHEPWLRIHTRAVTPPTGVRHYSNGLGAAYAVSSSACAEAITRQAETTLDFPRTIEAAYADGVRIFVEHGPGGACTNFISEILRGRDFVAVHLDRRGRGVAQIHEAAAALIAAGVEVDLDTLTARLTPPDLPRPAADGPLLIVPSHPQPITLPAREPAGQLMPPAPALPSVFWRPAERVLVSVAATASTAANLAPVAVDPATVTATATVTAVIEQQLATMTSLHRSFVEQQATMHDRFLGVRRDALAMLTSLPAPSLPFGGVTVIVRPGADPELMPPLDPPHTMPHPQVPRWLPPWDRQQLQIHSSGRISELFGPAFADQDRHPLQCRMPEPPLLLADRVTAIAAEPGVLGRGTIWTETDVQRDAWYLNGGYMPAGFMIESGQADLMLISYMGIDLLNQGERVYRLLGCTLTYHGDLPSPGETLRYEIRITGHARHGDVRLFFFEYDCTVDGHQRLTVRDAQAGFFNRRELDEALGVLWTPEQARDSLDPNARVDVPPVACTKSSFSHAEVVAFSEGRVLECFGPGYEWAETHTRTAKIQAGGQLFIDEVTSFDPTGGPWGRGFMRCETAIADDAWFFHGHFKNDPCMPGNFMVEACIEAMSFYLAAIGHTLRRDGWRFQPLPEQPFELKCRGEINPQTTRVVYELHVEEVHDGPHPTLIADVVGFVDGKAAFHAHRIGVELTPGWPLTSMPAISERLDDSVAVATDRDGFPFDWKAMISCAWGKPSEAFGAMYEIFDGTRRSPRLPGEPYHFISRVTHIDGDLGDCRAGMQIVCEYDIPDDAWYFAANGTEVMPFAVLLEAALQPCGWVASAVGSATTVDGDLLFRNLDGTGTVVDELIRTSGTLTTRVTLVTVSRAGAMIIEGFEVECALGDRVVYTMNTVFGFFPPDAFENQVGLAVTDSDRAALDAAGEVMVDLTLRPARFCAGSACLAEPMLLMIDRFTHLRGAGAAGLGVVRGEKDVDVSEWFFKAHFFQDPVQPGSLGIEALLQLLQCFMLDTDLAAGLPEPRFEPIMLGAPLTWKYRGQVTPNNALITTVMEIIEVGVDDRGPFVIGNGSLWCDGLRIYEVVGMGMRIVSGAAGTSVLRFCVDRTSHPQLADHSVNGVVVVPMVFALEWLARSAKAHPAAGGMNLAALSDVTVLKGLVVDQFAAEGRLDLVASARILSTSEHGQTLAVELVDEATGRTHYRCVASFTKLAPAPSTLAAPARGRLAAGVVYDNPVLFHGAAFHVIESIEPMSNGGVTATLAGVLACDWPSEPWVLDPALLDGALQMALVWTEHVLGLPSLPTAIASVCVFSAPCHGRFAAVLRGRTNSPHRVVCDVEIFDDRGALVAEVLGIETHVLPAASAR